MVIQTQLSPDMFFRLSVLRHIQRPHFYIYAFLCAAVGTYAIVQGSYGLMLLGSVPFGMYVLLGLIGSFRASRLKDAPYFLPTTYEFTNKGVLLRTSEGESDLKWGQFSSWRQMVDCYVLELEGGAILAIPRKAVPPHRTEPFTTLLQEHIK